ncbi:hypothetical protein KM043_006773 [Ampulex compressa]|nr:hypothetical protein KM043_006773 [Ampulex compressa]
MYKFLVVGILAATAMAVPMSPDENGLIATDLDCLEHENALFSCIFVKAANSLDRAARSSNIELIDGVTFVRETPMERNGKSLKTEVEMMNELPRDTSDRAIKLVSMLYDSAMSFMKTHSLKLSMPEGSAARALVEGRGKIKKMILPLIAAVGIKIFALVPILLGGLGLLALKALFVGKIALLLAGIMAFQKLFGSSSVSSGVNSVFSKNTQPGWFDGAASQGWSAGSVANSQPQGYYKRSFDVASEKQDAHSMAYAAQMPNETN